MYNNSGLPFLPQAEDKDIEREHNQLHLDEFFEDIVYELRNYGALEGVTICDNISRKLFSYWLLKSNFNSK